MRGGDTVPRALARKALAETVGGRWKAAEKTGKAPDGTKIKLTEWTLVPDESKRFPGNSDEVLDRSVRLMYDYAERLRSALRDPEAWDAIDNSGKPHREPAQVQFTLLDRLRPALTRSSSVSWVDGAYKSVELSGREKENVQLSAETRLVLKLTPTALNVVMDETESAPVLFLYGPAAERFRRQEDIEKDAQNRRDKRIAAGGCSRETVQDTPGCFRQ